MRTIVIPGRAEYLPWRLSETPPIITTKDSIEKINIRYVKTALSSSFLKVLNAQIIKNIKIIETNREIKNNKSLRLSFAEILSKFKPKISKINFGKLDPKKARITVLYTKLIVSYFEKSKIRAVLEDPISFVIVDIYINDNCIIEHINKIKKQIKLYLLFSLKKFKRNKGVNVQE
tara:strand:+ start:457 stop:981 length:525 start_codon:yes stop_codon:yes gene_type:complete